VRGGGGGVGGLPRTAKGKLDRSALPEPPRAAATPPRSETERALLAIWHEVLRHTDAGVEDPFETVGGHSLAAAQVAARIAARFGVDHVSASFARGATVAELAAALDAHAQRPPGLPPPPGPAAPAPPPAPGPRPADGRPAPPVVPRPLRPRRRGLDQRPGVRPGGDARHPCPAARAARPGRAARGAAHALRGHARRPG